MENQTAKASDVLDHAGQTEGPLDGQVPQKEQAQAEEKMDLAKSASADESFGTSAGTDESVRTEAMQTHYSTVHTDFSPAAQEEINNVIESAIEINKTVTPKLVLANPVTSPMCARL